MANRSAVLVVDDEQDVLDQIQELLEGKYELAIARTHDEAVRTFDSRRFDAVVLDIMGVNGEELLAKFRSRAPCIMLTAHALTPAHLKRTAKAGARLYLPKDELVRLGDYVDEVLRRPKEQLWGWLLGRLNFQRWFGSGWTELDKNFLEGLTIEEIEADLKSGGR